MYAGNGNRRQLRLNAVSYAEEIMSVQFNCPSCKATYEVADDLAGKMIMCRVCKKRGPVRSLTAAGSSAASLSAAGTSLATATPTRRNMLPYLGFFLASLGAVGVGALLARQPWDRSDPKDDWKGRRRGPDGQDKKDGKEGAA
jgi:hypothetical protein